MKACSTFAGVLVTVLLCVSRARAQDQLSLEWSAPSECPAAADVEVEIRRSLSHVRASAPVRVIGEVELDDEEQSYSLRVRVQHEGDVSERVLSVRDCAEVARASALFVALAIEYRAKPPPPAPPPPPPPTPPPPQPHWSATLGMHLSGGFGPKATPGVGASLAYANAPLRVVARGAVFAPTDKELDGNTSVGGEFSLWTVNVSVCAGDDLAVAEAWLCAGGRLYALSARGFGTDSDATEQTYVGAPVVGFDLGWHLSRTFLLVTGVEGGYTPASSRFVIENAGTVHETGRFFGEARLEFGVRF